MKKTTLIALLLASSLTLAGCAGIAEETPGNVDSGNGTVDRTPSETVDPTANSKVAEYQALTQAEFLALAPTEGSDVLKAELKAVIAASQAAGSEATFESVTFGEDTFQTVFYSNPSKNESLLSFVLGDDGAVVDETVLLYANMSLTLTDISQGFDDGVVRGISKDASGGYLVSIKYPQEDGTDISLIYYVVVKDGLVDVIVNTADYSPDMVVFVRQIGYGVNAEYEKLYDVAVVPAP
jgi:hypothetical protein